MAILLLKSGADSISALRLDVLKQLKARGVYRGDHIYRGFNLRLIEWVTQHGVENPHSVWIYANSEEYLSVDPDPMIVNPLRYALFWYGALAVYRGDRLSQFESCTYQFVGPGTRQESLIAIFRLAGACWF